MNDDFCQCHSVTPLYTRRDILKTLWCGFGYLAFASLATRVVAESTKSTGPLAPKLPHFRPRAKRVIFLCMRGGPSHVDKLITSRSLRPTRGRAEKGPAR